MFYSQDILWPTNSRCQVSHYQGLPPRICLLLVKRQGLLPYRSAFPWRTQTRSCCIPSSAPSASRSSSRRAHENMLTTKHVSVRTSEESQYVFYVSPIARNTLSVSERVSNTIGSIAFETFTRSSRLKTPVSKPIAVAPAYSAALTSIGVSPK